MWRKAGVSSARISGPMVWKRTARHGTPCAAMSTSRAWRPGASRRKSCSSRSARHDAAPQAKDVVVSELEQVQCRVITKAALHLLEAHLPSDLVSKINDHIDGVRDTAKDHSG